MQKIKSSYKAIKFEQYDSDFEIYNLKKFVKSTRGFFSQLLGNGIGSFEIHLHYGTRFGFKVQ